MMNQQQQQQITQQTKRIQPKRNISSSRTLEVKENGRSECVLIFIFSIAHRTRTFDRIKNEFSLNRHTAL